MVTFPGCKINIGLKIIGKRADGFHKLESVFYPLNLSDILEIIPSKTFSLQLSGLKIEGNQENNLIVKAFQLLKKHYAITPVKIHLHKVVPMGAGLGGGSADGAAALVVLNTLFDLKITPEQLEIFADQLGSDCAFFIKNKPAFVEGKGEHITNYNLNLKGYYLQLINPGIHVSTKSAFEGIPFSNSKNSLKAILQNPVDAWKNQVKNDFENTIFPIHPEIRTIKETLYKNGAVYASMTGTGSSVYGLFKTKPTNPFPQYFEWNTAL